MQSKHPQDSSDHISRAFRWEPGIDECVATLAKDDKYLGSDNIGATAVLHTWGRDMNYHPHVHMIVPGGGLSATGTEWLPSRVDFLVPVLALSNIFRAKFKHLMQECGLLEQIDPAVWQAGWNINCQAVGDGRQSLRYLAPYVFRVAIGNHASGESKLPRMVRARSHSWLSPVSSPAIDR